MSFRAWRAEGRGDFTDVIWHLFLNGSTSSCLPVSYATTRQKFAGWMATSKRAGFVAIFLHITIKWPVLLLVREGSGHKNIGNILIFKWKQRECFAFAKLLKHFPRFLSRYPLSVSRFYVPLHPSVPLLPREVPKESPRQPLGRSFSTIYKNRAFFCKTKSLPKGAIPEKSVVFHSFHF